MTIVVALLNKLNPPGRRVTLQPLLAYLVIEFGRLFVGRTNSPSALTITAGMSTLLVGFDSAWTATNPQRKRTFSQSDWEHVCRLARSAFSELGLVGLAEWIDREAQNKSPRKSDQDCLDACVCLLVALQFAEGKDCLKVGNHQTGYIVVPDSVGLRSELEARCNRTCRLPSEWIRVFRLEGRTPGALHLNAPPNIALEPSAP